MHGRVFFFGGRRLILGWAVYYSVYDQSRDGGQRTLPCGRVFFWERGCLVGGRCPYFSDGSPPASGLGLLLILYEAIRGYTSLLPFLLIVFFFCIPPCDRYSQEQVSIEYHSSSCVFVFFFPPSDPTLLILWYFFGKLPTPIPRPSPPLLLPPTMILARVQHRI